MTNFGRLLFVLCFILAAPVVAQEPDEQLPVDVVSGPTPEERIADLQRRNDELRYGLDVARIHVDLVDRQTAWFSILISIFGLVVTAVVIYFAFRFGQQGVKEATAAAKDAIDAERQQVEALLEEARSSVSNIKQREAEANRITDNLKAGEVPDDEETRNSVNEIASDAENKRKRERTAGDYRALITRAAMKKDWNEAEKQARAMEAVLDDDDDPSETAFALFSLAAAQGKQGKREQAITIYDDLLARFGESHDLASQEQVAKALVNKGVDLGALGRSEEAITTYDQVFERFGKSDMPALKVQVANALFNKGFRLGELKRDGEEIEAYDEVLRHFGKSDLPVLKEQVLSALFNKACAFALRGNAPAAIQALSQWNDRAGHLDCNKIAKDSDFDKLRDHPDFRKFLEDNGCDCGPPPPDPPIEPDLDAPNPPEDEEAAGPGSD